MDETAIQNRIRLALSQQGVRIFRNQTGGYKLPDGTWLRSGLCRGSSDLIGWTSRIVTPEMVGSQVALFTAIEVKAARGRVTSEQQQFLEAVAQAGGIAFTARSAEEAVALLNR